uniref:Predicted protein n=1 Tax=Hordeum vulgare subsp. vulgare TaxID=112509 RepID=F2E4K2_HORVV|nr:predicted protein [Hordeum vulgare subsp. vulgare]
MAESAVKAVVGNVSKLAVHETSFLCGVTSEVGFLKDELKRLKCYLRSADAKRKSGDECVATWLSQIRDVTYESENVIEAADYMGKKNRLKNGFLGAISRYARLPSDMVTLHNVGVDIQRIRRKISEIFDSANRLNIDLDTSVLGKCCAEDEFPRVNDLMDQNFEDDVAIVGFEDEYQEITDKLVDKENNTLSAISIVAMGGAGKTSLVRKIYTSSRVKEHFDTAAWVTVSQKFKAVDLLTSIMEQIMNIFAYMPHLVDIHLSSFGVLDKLPDSNHFPQSLRQLYLEAGVIEIDPMPILEKLPCLVVLESSGYKGRTMTFSAQGFPRLQELKT